MVKWHHQLNGHEFGSIPGDGDGQGGLACYGSWGRKEQDTSKEMEHAHTHAHTSRLYIGILLI